MKKMWKIEWERNSNNFRVNFDWLWNIRQFQWRFSLAHTHTDKRFGYWGWFFFSFFSLAFDYYEWTKHTTNQTTNKQYLNFFSIVILNTIWVIVFFLCVWRMRGAIYFFNIEQSLSLSGSLTPIINNNNK